MHPHARDAQHFVNCFDVAFYTRDEGVSFDGNLTHCQCAGKSAE